MNLTDLKSRITSEALVLSSNSEKIYSPTGRPLQFIIDLRALLLQPEVLTFISQEFWKRYKHLKKVQIAGLELASISLMTAIVLDATSHGCQASGIIVRKSRKKYGLQRVIEGEFSSDIPTVIVDDIVNSGQSILKVLVQLAEEGIHPRDVFSLMDYKNSAKEKEFQHRELNHDFLISLEELENIPRRSRPEEFACYQTIFAYNPQTPSNQYNIICRSNPVVDEERVFYGTDAAQMVALDKKTGTPVWTYSAVRADHLKGIWSSPLIVGRGLCFGCYDGNLYYLDRRTGEVLWICSQANFIGSSPDYSEEDQLIYVGMEYALPGQHGSVAAVDIQTGKIKWEHRTYSFVHSSPLYLKNHKMVVCGSNGHDLMAFDSKTGSLLWRVVLGGTCKMRPACSENQNILYVACTNNSIQAVETLTGRVLWIYQTQFANRATPLRVDDKLIVAGLDNCIHILNEKNGELLNKIQTDGRLMSEPSFHMGKVYLGNNAGAVFELNLTTLELEGRYQLPDRVLSRVAFDNDRNQFYAHTGDDRLFSWKKI